MTVNTTPAPAMFTEAGRNACRNAMRRVAINCQPQGSLQPTRTFVIDAVRQARREIAADHPEVYDTEVRWWFIDRANELLADLGYAGVEYIF